MEDAQRVESLLATLLTCAGFELSYRVKRHDRGMIPRLTVEFDGPDVPLLLLNRGEVLLALEHLAAKALRLDAEEHDQISFEAAGFKANRARTLNESAERAVRLVRTSGEAFKFPPMSSRERRMLHLTLAASGLSAASEGEGSQRHLVLHPHGSRD